MNIKCKFFSLIFLFTNSNFCAEIKRIAFIQEHPCPLFHKLVDKDDNKKFELIVDSFWDWEKIYWNNLNEEQKQIITEYICYAMYYLSHNYLDFQILIKLENLKIEQHPGIYTTLYLNLILKYIIQKNLFLIRLNLYLENLSDSNLKELIKEYALIKIAASKDILYNLYHYYQLTYTSSKNKKFIYGLFKGQDLIFPDKLLAKFNKLKTTELSKLKHDIIIMIGPDEFEIHEKKIDDIYESVTNAG